MLVEDRAAMALEGQVVGGGEAGRAAADDRYFLAGRLFRGLELEAVLDCPVAEVVLDRVDADMVLDLVAVAAGFTGGGADAAHHGGQRVGFGQAAPRILLPGHGRLAVGAERGFLDAAHDVEVAADVLAGRAGALAGWRRLDVGRALVGIAGLENLLLPTLELGVAFLVAAEVQFLGLDFRRG
jgi:hypothetical protein